MKSIKRLISVILCAAILLSAAPILKLDLFKTEAVAASYAKKHEKEYYYASGTKFIQYLATGYGKNVNNAKNPLTGKGYTVIDMDLNKDASGKYVYLGYITTTDPAQAINDLRISIKKDADQYTAPENSCQYTVVGVNPTSKNTGDADGIVDLNKDAGGDYLYYFATKDAKAGDPIVEISIDTTEQQSGLETVKYLNSDMFTVNADANKKAGGAFIYTHLKRLPQVDTTGLRSSLASADQALAGTNFTEESLAVLTTARNAGKAITDAYDNYTAGTASYSSVYTQAKIDSAKTAIDAAIAGLVEKIDSDTAPSVTFYVPETIYLDPSDNQTFQYFYGLDINGNPEKNISLETAAKGARIYFKGNNCNPSNLRITVQASSNNATSWTATSSSNLSSIIYGGTTFNGATADSTGYIHTAVPVNIQCTGGKLSSAVPSGGYKFLKWTAHYVLDGITFETYAYSVCYAPYDKPVAAASRAYTDRGINQRLQQIAWISGVVGSSNDGNRTNNTTNFNPIKGVVNTPTNTTNNGGLDVTGDIFFNGTSGTAYLANFSNGEVNAQTQAVAPTGKLVLDSTRFSNLKNIPNLKIGYLLAEVWEGSNSVKERRFGYYLSDVSGISYDASSETTGKGWEVYSDNRGTYIVSDTDKEDTSEKIDREYCRPRLVYNGVWDKEISTSKTVAIKGAARFGTRRDSIISDNNGNVNCAGVVPLEVTVINKTELRKTVNEAVSKSRQKTWYTTGYDVYQNSILSAALDLGNPSSTVTKATINSSGLSRDEGTVTISYVRDAVGGADYNGKTESAIIGSSSETADFTCGEDVTVTSKDFTGFTLSYYTITSGSEILAKESAHTEKEYVIKGTPRSNLEFKFWYVPNKYNVTYDPNGGTFQEKTNVVNEGVYYQSKFTLGSYNGKSPADPVRNGYKFAGWLSSQDGQIHQTGESYNWVYTYGIKYVAQWVPINYTVVYDSNAGNGKVSGSTANSTHTYDVEKQLSANGYSRTIDFTLDYNYSGTTNDTQTYTTSFAGWSRNVNDALAYTDKQSVSNLTTTDGATVTLYAKWNDVTVNLPMPTRTGYAFDGWYTQRTGGQKVSQAYSFVSSTTLYAHWIPYTYTIEYNGNGATSGSTENSIHSYGESKELTENGYKREFTVTYDYNYSGSVPTKDTVSATFKGWATSPDGSVTYNNRHMVSNLTATDGTIITLYAKWTDKSVQLPTPTRSGYTFDGWFDENGIKVTESIIPTRDMVLTAHWTEKTKYTVTFKNGDEVLQSGQWYVGDTPIYNGAVPTKAADDEYEYTFRGWSPAIKNVDGDITYIAQFNSIMHSYKCVQVDKKYHKSICTACGHEKASEPHNFTVKELADSYVSECSDCGFTSTARKYTVETTSACTVTYSVKPTLTPDYMVATIVAPQKSGDNYFVYWIDGDGNIVGTYRTYSFFVTDDCSFSPVYVSIDRYTAEREKATTISRVTGGRLNNDGSYSIYAEHSVSKTVGNITGHGVLYTTDSAYAGSLTIDNDNITKKAARTTERTLTGLLAVTDNFNAGDTVWARSYIIDGEGNVVYGETKVMTVGENGSASELDTLGCENFDLTVVNADGDSPTDPKVDDEPSVTDKLTTFFTKVIEFIRMIINFVINRGVIIVK